MAVFRIFATEPHGRRLLVAVVEAESKAAAVEGYLAEVPTVAGRTHVAERVT